MPHYNFPDSYIKSVAAGTEFHQKYKTWSGKGTMQYVDHIKNIVEKHDVKTVLDFGCGKGLQYSKFNLDKELGFDVTCYDPCIHGLDNWPKGKFDLILALDCISLIDLKDYPWIYQNFINWSNKAVFIATQIGNYGKEIKQKSASGIEKIQYENDLIISDLLDNTNINFYIMNNLKFIHPKE